MTQKFEDIIAWQKAVSHSVRNASLGRKRTISKSAFRRNATKNIKQ